MQLQPSIDDPDRAYDHSQRSTYPPDSHRDRVLQDPVDYTCHRRTAAPPSAALPICGTAPRQHGTLTYSSASRPEVQNRIENTPTKVKKGGMPESLQRSRDRRTTDNQQSLILRTNPSNNRSAPTLEMDGGPGALGETDCISACGGSLGF